MDGISQDEAREAREDVEELELARLVYIGVALAVAAVLTTALYWGFRRIEARIAGRHPLLTEMLEEVTDPGWPLR